MWSQNCGSFIVSDDVDYAYKEVLGECAECVYLFFAQLDHDRLEWYKEFVAIW